MRLKPQRSSDWARIEPEFPPPRRFITVAMELAIMSATEWDRELVADFAPECRVLQSADDASRGRHLGFSLWTRPRDERIQHGNSCSLKIRDVAGHNCEAMFKRSCGDRQIETSIADLL
jgi:hypothetical protein